MIYGCLIICRSITYAQRAQYILQRKGYTATGVRPSVEVIGDSCGFAVKIYERYLADAIYILRSNGIEPVRVVVVEESGRIREVRI